MKEQESPKASLKILNSREKKELNEKVEAQWGASFDKSLVFLMSNKEKVYIANPEISNIDFSKIKIDNVGLYICSIARDDIRLSIEGSQIIGCNAKKNVLKITDDEVRDWLRGLDLARRDTGFSGYVIIKHKDDFLGCGKVSEKGIFNFVPKTRRILGSS
jgi:NOL1/NOP2/fmu family ribosome biogenesis protein